MGLVVGDHQGGFHIVAAVFGGLLGKAGLAHVQARKPAHGSAQHAWEALVLSRQSLGEGPALQIGRGAHRRPLRFAGEAVFHQSAVPGGIDVRQIGAQLFVHHNGAPL